MNNLNDLLTALLNNTPDVLDHHGQWRTDLPTFGGQEPENTHGIWSWDEQNLLVGTSADDLRIVPREE